MTIDYLLSGSLTIQPATMSIVSATLLGMLIIWRMRRP